MAADGEDLLPYLQHERSLQLAVLDCRCILNELLTSFLVIGIHPTTAVLTTKARQMNTANNPQRLFAAPRARLIIYCVNTQRRWISLFSKFSTPWLRL